MHKGAWIEQTMDTIMDHLMWSVYFISNTQRGEILKVGSNHCSWDSARGMMWKHRIKGNQALMKAIILSNKDSSQRLFLSLCFETFYLYSIVFHFAVRLPKHALRIAICQTSLYNVMK